MRPSCSPMPGFSFPCPSAPHPSLHVCTIPGGKITSVARGRIYVEINNQSRENGWNKEQYPVISGFS